MVPMTDKVIALSDELSDLDLACCYIPMSHFALVELGKKNNTFVVAPKRYWSTLYHAGCFGDVVMFDGTLESYLSGIKQVTDNFIIIEKADDELLAQLLLVKISPMDRFQVYNNRLRMLRALVHDRSMPHKSRNRGVHGVIFPGFEIPMLTSLFSYLHTNLHIQPVAPIISGERRPDARFPYGHFEIQVNYQRLLEIIASAKFCVGLPGPFTYISIYMNIPTAVIVYEHEMPKRIPGFWGHVQRVYCPERICDNGVLRAVEEVNFFYEYLSS